MAWSWSKLHIPLLKTSRARWSAGPGKKKRLGDNSRNITNEPQRIFHWRVKMISVFSTVTFVRIEDIFGRWPCQNYFDLVLKFPSCGSFREISVGHRLLIFALSCTSLRRLKLMQQCLEQIGLCPNPEMINLPWRVCSLSKRNIFLPIILLNDASLDAILPTPRLTVIYKQNSNMGKNFLHSNDLWHVTTMLSIQGMFIFSKSTKLRAPECLDPFSQITTRLKEKWGCLG